MNVPGPATTDTAQASQSMRMVEVSANPWNKNPILILFHRLVTQAEVEALARYFVAADWPVVIAAQNRDTASGLKLPSSNRLQVIDFMGRLIPINRTTVSTPTDVPRSSTIKLSLRHRLKASLVRYGGLRAPILWLGLRRDLRQARQLLADLKPACLLVADDRTPRPEMCFLNAAKKHGIPSVLFSYASSSLESDIYIRGARPDCHLSGGTVHWLKRWLASRFPNHLCPRPEKGLLFFGVWDMLALVAAGLTDTRPWILGGGECSAVTVLGPGDRKALLEAGLSHEKVHVTGQASLDASYVDPARRSELRTIFGRRYGIDPTRPWILCAVPHLAEHNACPWEEHMENTRTLFSVMADSTAEVLLSLHPKSHRETYEAEAEAAGAHILDEPLSDMLPLADIFIATYSSTVRWAAMLGIATIIVDFTDLNYHMYDHLTALRVARGEADLKQALNLLTQDDARRRTIAMSLQHEAVIIGRLDGQACHRIHDLVLSLCTQFSQPTSSH